MNTQTQEEFEKWFWSCNSDEYNKSEYEIAMRAWEACKEALATHEDSSLVQLSQDEKFCDGNCVWTDHHPNCKLAKPIQDAINFLDGSYEAHKIRKALQEALKDKNT